MQQHIYKLVLFFHQLGSSVVQLLLDKSNLGHNHSDLTLYLLSSRLYRYCIVWEDKGEKVPRPLKKWTEPQSYEFQVNFKQQVESMAPWLNRKPKQSIKSKGFSVLPASSVKEPKSEVFFKVFVQLLLIVKILASTILHQTALPTDRHPDRTTVPLFVV